MLNFVKVFHVIVIFHSYYFTDFNDIRIFVLQQHFGKFYSLQYEDNLKFGLLSLNSCSYIARNKTSLVILLDFYTACMLQDIFKTYELYIFQKTFVRLFAKSKQKSTKFKGANHLNARACF